MALPDGFGGLNVASQNFEWVKLPDLAQKHVFTFLPRRDLNNLMLTCKDAHYMIQHEYGIHVILPARNFSGWHLNAGHVVRTGVHITDKMIKRALAHMEGKVIRTVDITETPPGFDLPTFDKFIRQPWRLRHVSLAYVDVRLIHKFLSSCRNMNSFKYETGLVRPLPNGPISFLLVGASYQPVTVPCGEQEFVDVVKGLLPDSFRLRFLTSLTLSFRNISRFHRSDYLNVLYLLMALPVSKSTENLKRFKFVVQAGLPLTSRDGLMVLALVGSFLTGSPSLKNLEYESTLRCSEGVDALFLSEQVITSIIQQLGSEDLKEILPGFRQNEREIMQRDVRELMREAGRKLIHIQNFKLKLSDDLESNAFRALITSLASVKNLNIEDYFGFGRGPTHDGLYDLLIADENPFLPFLPHIEKLSMRRNCAISADPAINNTSLTSLLGNMPSLIELEVSVDGAVIPSHAYWLLNGEEENFQVQEPDAEGRVVILEGVRITQRPNFTLGEALGTEEIFQKIQVLKLRNVTMLTRDTARLRNWRSLEELELELNPGYRHTHFGIYSGDLLELITSMRNLQKLSINPVYFPQDNQALLEEHQNRLREIGRLETAAPVQRDDGFGNLIEIQPRPNRPVAYRFVFDQNIIIGEEQ